MCKSWRIHVSYGIACVRVGSPLASNTDSYIDDVAWLFSDSKVANKVEAEYAETFRCDFGECTKFLGVTVERDQEHKKVHTQQTGKIEALAEKWLPEDSAPSLPP